MGPYTSGAEAPKRLDAYVRVETRTSETATAAGLKTGATQGKGKGEPQIPACRLPAGRQGRQASQKRLRMTAWRQRQQRTARSVCATRGKSKGCPNKIGRFRG